MSEPIDELGVSVGIEMDDQEMEKSISYFAQLEKAAADAAAAMGGIKPPKMPRGGQGGRPPARGGSERPPARGSRDGADFIDLAKTGLAGAGALGALSLGGVSAIGVGAAAAVGYGLHELFGFAAEKMFEADEIAKRARAYNIDPEVMQQHQHLYGSYGGTENEFFSALMKLNSLQRDMTGGRVPQQIVDAQSIAAQFGYDTSFVDIFSQKNRNSAEMLADLIGRLAPIQDPVAQQDILSGLGIDSIGLRNLVMGGVEQYKQSLKQGQDIGTYDKTTLDLGERFAQFAADYDLSTLR